MLCRGGYACALTDDHKAAREDETVRSTGWQAVPSPHFAFSYTSTTLPLCGMKSFAGRNITASQDCYLPFTYHTQQMQRVLYFPAALDAQSHLLCMAVQLTGFLLPNVAAECGSMDTGDLACVCISLLCLSRAYCQNILAMAFPEACSPFTLRSCRIQELLV